MRGPGRAVDVTAETVLCGDVFTVGGRLLVVVDLVRLREGGRRVLFASGEALTMNRGSWMTVTRTYGGAGR